MVFSVEDGVNLIQNVVSTWTKKYLHHTKFVDGNNRYLRYTTTFSIPTVEKPVPEGVVHVHFEITNLAHRHPNITYRFENESLRHKTELTLGDGQFELWLDRILSSKLRVRKLINLTTDFEKVRLAPPASSGLGGLGPDEEDEEDEDDREVRVVVTGGKMKQEDMSQEGSLLSRTKVILEQFTSLRKRLTQLFKSADVDDSGRLSFTEFCNLLHSANPNLSEWELRLLAAAADENQDGELDYKEFLNIAVDLIQSLDAARADAAPQTADDDVTEEELEAVIGAEIYDSTSLAEERLAVYDPEKTGILPASIVKEVLLSCCYVSSDAPPVSHRSPSSPSSSPSHSAPTSRSLAGSASVLKLGFTPREVRLLMQCLPPDDVDPDKLQYTYMYSVLLDIRMKSLREGCLGRSRREMFAYLNRHFSKYDVLGNGFLPIHQVRKALLSLDLVILSHVQTLALLSAFPTEQLPGTSVAPGEAPPMLPHVAIADAVETISEFFERMFSPRAIKERAALMPDTSALDSRLVDTEKKLHELFIAHDVDQSGYLEAEEFRSLLAAEDLHLTKEETNLLKISADLDGDGRISYQEFLPMGIVVLNQVRLQTGSLSQPSSS